MLFWIFDAVITCEHLEHKWMKIFVHNWIFYLGSVNWFSFSIISRLFGKQNAFVLKHRTISNFFFLLYQTHKRTHLANVTRFSPSVRFTTWFLKMISEINDDQSESHRLIKLFSLFGVRWKHIFLSFFLSHTCVCINPFLWTPTAVRIWVGRKMSVKHLMGKELTKLSGWNWIPLADYFPSLCCWLQNVLFHIESSSITFFFFLFSLSSTDCPTIKRLPRCRRSKWLYKWLFEHK